MRSLIDPAYPGLSIVRQCELLGVSRSGLYYQPLEGGADHALAYENIHLRRLLDEQYMRTPFYGVRRMTAWLRTQEYIVNHKRVRRLMRELGLAAIYPGPNTSKAASGHRIYPYLLRGLPIERKDQVWSTDITYIRLRGGFVYLTAVIDWFSRCVLSFRVSNTLESAFCLEALDEALGRGKPEIFNTDQGSQFTSSDFTGRLEKAEVKISMDGRGRALDNIFVERLWRSVKYEEVYLKDYGTAGIAIKSLGEYFHFYNHERLHQALGYRTPAAIYAETAAQVSLAVG